MKTIIFAGLLAGLTGASQAQTMYRCGSTYSQTPCGAGQKEIEVKAEDPCELEANKYSSTCIMRPSKPYSSKPSAAEEKKQAAYEKAQQEYVDRKARELEFQKKQSEKAAEDYKNQLISQGKNSALQIEERNKRPAPSPSKIQSNKAKCISEIKVTLKDPQSAIFSNVERTKPANDYTISPVSPTVWYLVTVNAKNSFGAFTGADQKFCAFDLEENNILYVR